MLGGKIIPLLMSLVIVVVAAGCGGGNAGGGRNGIGADSGSTSSTNTTEETAESEQRPADTEGGKDRFARSRKEITVYKIEEVKRKDGT